MRYFSLTLVLLALLLSPLAVLGQEEEPPPSSEGFSQAGQSINSFPPGDSPRDNPGGISTRRESSSLNYGGASVTALVPILKTGDILGAMRLTYNQADTQTNTIVYLTACEDIRDRSDPCWNSSFIDGGFYDRALVYAGDTNDCPTRDGKIHSTYTRVLIRVPGAGDRLAESPDNDAGEFDTGYRCREND
jgi:hypothetical protein